MQILRAAEYRRVAWKNGGGKTADIDVVRNASDVVWRLSIAGIERDGPFSDFRGFDRTIVLHDGCGIALDDGRRACVLDRPFAVHRFDGANAPMCRLVDGPVRAFNVLSAKATHAHDVSIGALPGSLACEPDAALYITVLRGSAQFIRRKSCGESALGADRAVLGADDSVRVFDAVSVDAPPSTVAAVVRITTRR